MDGASTERSTVPVGKILWIECPVGAYSAGVFGIVPLNSPVRLERYRSLFKWVFLVSLPLLIALHAPMLPSEALPHRAYHAAQSALGPSFSVLVRVGILTPTISLLGFVVATAMARLK